MIKFHAVMKSETGEEFGADIEALDRESAYEGLADRYPESRCVQLESPEDARAREHRTYERAMADEYGQDDFEEDY